MPNSGSFGRYLTRSEDLDEVYRQCICVLDRMRLDYRRIGPRDGSFSLRGSVYHRGLAVLQGIMAVISRYRRNQIFDPKVWFEISGRHLESSSRPRPTLTLSVSPAGRCPMLSEAEAGQSYVENHGNSAHADKWFKEISRALFHFKVLLD